MVTRRYRISHLRSPKKIETRYLRKHYLWIYIVNNLLSSNASKKTTPKQDHTIASRTCAQKEEKFPPSNYTLINITACTKNIDVNSQGSTKLLGFRSSFFGICSRPCVIIQVLVTELADKVVELLWATRPVVVRHTRDFTFFNGAQDRSKERPACD